MGASQSRQGRKRSAVVDIVLDLDHTLVIADFSSSPSSSSSACPPSPFISLHSERFSRPIRYLVAPYALQFLRALLERERAGELRLSFFSTGHAWRNERLVPLLIERAWALRCKTTFARDDNTDCERDTETETETASEAAVSVEQERHSELSLSLSSASSLQSPHKSLTHTNRSSTPSVPSTAVVPRIRASPSPSSSPSLPSPWRWPWRHSTHRHHRVLSKQQLDAQGKKDLTRVHRSLSLSRAILVDDLPSSAAAGQTANLLLLSPGLGAHPSTLSESESQRVRENLVRALGVILTALALAAENERENVISREKEKKIHSMSNSDAIIEKTKVNIQERITVRRALQIVLENERNDERIARDIVHKGRREIEQFCI